MKGVGKEVKESKGVEGERTGQTENHQDIIKQQKRGNDCKEKIVMQLMDVRKLSRGLFIIRYSPLST